MKVYLLLGSAAGGAIVMANEDPLAAHSSSRSVQHDNSIRERLAYAAASSSSQNRDLLAVPRTRPSSDGRKQDSSGTNESTTLTAEAKSAKTGQDVPGEDDVMGKTSKATGPLGSKTGKGGSKSGKASQDAYYIGPLSCPNQCIDVSGVDFLSGLLTNVIRRCDNESIDQRWLVHKDETFLKLESIVYPDMCIGIQDRSSCSGGILALGDCADHESMWYFTGGQLISAFCWVNGFTNVMGVFPTTGGRCDPSLNAFPGTDSQVAQVVRAGLFMFIDEKSIVGNVPTQEPTNEYSFPKSSPTFMPSYIPTKSPT